MQTPVGKDLLDLISMRCQGTGTKLQDGRVTVTYGSGTLVPGRINPMKAVFGTVSADLGPGDTRTNTPLMIKTDQGKIQLGNMTTVGQGTSTRVDYNPFISIGDVKVPTMGNITIAQIIGVETPAFVALAHELVHSLSGDAKDYPFAEEAWTVGAGKYADTRISENAVRKEHGIPLREYYSTPGDCD